MVNIYIYTVGCKHNQFIKGRGPIVQVEGQPLRLNVGELDESDQTSLMYHCSGRIWLFYHLWGYYNTILCNYMYTVSIHIYIHNHIYICIHIYIILLHSYTWNIFIHTYIHNHKNIIYNSLHIYINTIYMYIYNV
jgi:hypothetical protein